MARSRSKTKPKPKILRWRGVLAESSRMVRVVVAILLITASIALTATQLGFVGIGFDGEYVAYALVLLQPVALAALLLGTLPATAIGFVAGAVLYVHSRVLPLDFFELSFVNPVTSIVMLTVAGLLLGVLFAFVLRNNPTGLRRHIYIGIACIVVSFLYSLGFGVNVFLSLFIELANESIASSQVVISDETQSYIVAVARRLGSGDIQVLFDALMMIALCSLGDYLARRAQREAPNAGLRDIFGAWLAVVVTFAFMLSATVSFIAITVNGLSEAQKDLSSEVNYLYNQLVAHENDSLLVGYAVEDDGIVVIADRSGAIHLADDDDLETGHLLSEYFDEREIAAIELSLESGNMQRIVHDGIDLSTIKEEIAADADGLVRTQIMYLAARDAGDYTAIVAKPSSMVFESRSSSMLWVTISSLVLLLAVFALAFRLLDSLVARRIDEINGALQRITHGNLETRVEAGGTREFKSLSAGINETVGAMRGLIAEAETRMDAELATAKAIQEAALPRIFPPYPDILRFDVYATMQAAREVGGDFYDFFLIGDDCNPDSGKLGFVIADVSGKGVPAALFMMKAKTQLRDYMTSGMELGEAIENANRQLCDGNDAGMFVTVWAGELDYATGHVDFVNAGHNPPMLWQQVGGGWRWVSEKSGLPLGLFAEMPYTAHSIDCQIGDQFLLYTDGVTEAVDEANNAYGESRLEAVAGENYPLHPRELVKSVREDVAAHVKGAEQSDDITMLALEVGVPPEITATLVVPADTGELPRVNAFIHEELDRRLCPMRTQNQLDIAVEELFVNVAHYAYPDATPDNPGTVRVSYTYSAEPPSITVDIADDGIPYNPLDKPDAVTPDDIMEVPIGGLGILMAKRNVDEMSYERSDGSNIVTIVKKW